MGLKKGKTDALRDTFCHFCNPTMHQICDILLFAINPMGSMSPPPPKKNKFLPVGQESDNYLFRQNFCSQPGTPLHLYPAPQVKQLLWRMLYMYSGREKCNINMPQDISKPPHQSTPTCSTGRNFLGRRCTMRWDWCQMCSVSLAGRSAIPVFYAQSIALIQTKPLTAKNKNTISFFYIHLCVILK